MRRRLDAELVRRGLAPSRAEAARLVEAGRVLVSGTVAQKSSRQVDPGEAVVVAGPPARFVGRGGEKLEGAMERFGLDAEGVRALDAGASTGGFTDCLLQRGAAEVVALDVGHGQLHQRLRDDPRVVVIERTNLRHVDPEELGPFDAAVADLSFISLTAVLDTLVACCRTGAWLVVLVKPQFEAGRAEVSRGRGVIRDPEVWRRSLGRVVDAASGAGASMMDVMASPLRGADGNTEFLLHLRRDAPAPGATPPDAALDAVVAEAAALVGGPQAPTEADA